VVRWVYKLSKGYEKQYKKIPNSWKYIRRYDQPTKTLSPKAINILAVAMYQANKYNQAILTHRVLKEITERKRHQNRRLVQQLEFLFEVRFLTSLIENNKTYNNAFLFLPKNNLMKILENPENYFANLGGHLGEHLGEHNTKKGSKNAPQI